jgi:hypothetical protein
MKAFKFFIFLVRPKKALIEIEKLVEENLRKYPLEKNYLFTFVLSSFIR